MMWPSHDVRGNDDGVGKAYRGTTGNVGGHDELAQVGGAHFLPEAQPTAGRGEL